MPFDTAEKRFSAIHLTKRSGLPVPTGDIPENKRLHFIGIFSTITVNASPFYFWRNKCLPIFEKWVAKGVPTNSWGRKAAPATKWSGRSIPPPDSSTQVI